ncbi:MAG: GGDEF domain-containing protein, partial [Acidimicrobiales bacterium]|nr:GGDEF domain-containing protein [Acidimicrobiales bacterium]
AFGAVHVVSYPILDIGGGLTGAIVAWLPFGPVEQGLPEGAGQFAGSLARLAILQERNARSLLHQASTDALTGLANRSGLARVLENVSEDDLPLALVYCDLDRFKAVNDTYGHGAGDRLLVHVAESIKLATRADDVGVRMGGDEFVVVCPRVTSRLHAEGIVARLRNRVENPVDVGDDVVVPRVSMGLAVADTVEQLASLAESADEALYADKASRRTQSSR